MPRALRALGWVAVFSVVGFGSLRVSPSLAEAGAEALPWSAAHDLFGGLAPPHALAVARGPTAEAPAPFLALPALQITHLGTKAELRVRLYDAGGHVAESSALALDALLGDHRDPKHPATTKIDQRTLQLVFRAAYHFGAERIEVVSAYRKPGRRREGPHGRGTAIDFKVPGVAAPALAQYLRKLSRVGVGIYTHRRTQYVHLDVRDESFHWLDASPPGRSWREMSLGTPGISVRDAAYDRTQDWPEGLPVPPA